MILTIDPDSPQPDLLDRVAELLTAGGLVVAPTETRYGLLARADDQQWLEQLYLLKERDLNQPTALLVRDAAEIRQAGHSTAAAEVLIQHFLPGPLTLVLGARQDWPPPRVVDGKIGFRWSSTALIDALLSRFDFPVTATSANLSGQSDSETVQEIERDFGERVGLYLDAGPLDGATSTVVDCSSDNPVILREGAIPASEVKAVLDRNV